MSTAGLPLVVYCHLRWDFVYQRPQQILARLASARRVLVIEEPVHHDGPACLVLTKPAPGIVRCVPHGPIATAGFGAETAGTFGMLLARLLERQDLERHVAWLYTPMAVPLARSLRPSTVVYDCMDELAGFLGAPPSLRAYEDELFRWTDLVFTGGPSLYRAKRDLHPHVHCLPSSVDVAHFRRGRDARLEAAEQMRIPRPRLGFFGVIDERLDTGLLAAVAAARPAWQLVMVGPVVKIAPESLPQAPNVRWLGQRSYETLPALLAGWDVCLLPFALNRATRFISPTKVLEYMAAEHPIVSTPITDVVEPYGEVVRIASTAADFVLACEAALCERADERAARAAHMRRIVNLTSWDATAARMGELVDGVTTTAKERWAWTSTAPSSSAQAPRV
jgi:glycosyltransferase involved in cell wall biosynthesis